SDTLRGLPPLEQAVTRARSTIVDTTAAARHPRIISTPYACKERQDTTRYGGAPGPGRPVPARGAKPWFDRVGAIASACSTIAVHGVLFAARAPHHVASGP